MQENEAPENEEESKETKKKSKMPLNSFALVTQIAINIIANLAVAFLLGYFIDNFLGTMPIFLLIFIFLGIGSAMMSIYHTVNKYF
ncbi:MAG: AtpZ/AtpI family protein [Defluviitaleaceae bacterium]|nr:AtpZ/AtpI family protein [Defluviitaleaceae bacterium]